MNRQTAARPAPVAVVCLLLSGSFPAVGQETSSAYHHYRIRPSEVAVPAGVPLGKYRRSITPFENWTLICDENLQARHMVCNVSQVIEDMSGGIVFSWSLAATEDGKPYMILRTSPQADPAGQISLSFAGRSNPVKAAINGCNETVCVGMVPVGPVMRAQIGKAAEPIITYATKTGENISVTASLKGLATALSAIN